MKNHKPGGAGTNEKSKAMAASHKQARAAGDRQANKLASSSLVSDSAALIAQGGNPAPKGQPQFPGFNRPLLGN
jgi:hypothetical protein